jgi:hypothetical protein
MWVIALCAKAGLVVAIMRLPTKVPMARRERRATMGIRIERLPQLKLCEIWWRLQLGDKQEIDAVDQE